MYVARHGFDLKFPTSKTRSKLYTHTAVTHWLPKHKQSTCQVTWQVDCLYIDNLRLRTARVSQKSSAEWPTQAGRAGRLTGIFVYVLKKEAIANCFLKKFLKNQFLNT